MVQLQPDTSTRPKAASNSPIPTKDANLFPVSNVHVVEPGHLAADAARGHKKHRGLIIVLVLLGLAFVGGFIFLGLRYYNAVLAPGKGQISNECYEVSIPNSLSGQVANLLIGGLAASDKRIDDATCAEQRLGINSDGDGGGFLAFRSKDKLSAAVDQKKIGDLYQLQLAKNKKIISSTEETLDGSTMTKIVAEGVVTEENKGVVTLYVGVKNGYLYNISWFRFSDDGVIKSDIEKSIASFRWK